VKCRWRSARANRLAKVIAFGAAEVRPAATDGQKSKSDKKGPPADPEGQGWMDLVLTRRLTIAGEPAEPGLVLGQIHPAQVLSNAQLVWLVSKGRGVLRVQRELQPSI